MIDIVIVNYNSTAYLLDCLDTVYRFADGVPCRVFVQDNGSTDNVDDIPRYFPQAVLERHGANLGFARAVNRGMAKGRAGYVMLLNPDSRVTPGFFRAALEFMERHPRVGVMGPKILDADGQLQNSARSFPTPLTALFGRDSFLSRRFPGNPITSRNLLSLKSDGVSPMSVDWVSGACMVARRAAVDQVGPLDERFFMYWEDTDWCRRMGAAGWRVVYYPKIAIYHHVGGSSQKTPFRSQLEFHKSVCRLYHKYHRRSGPAMMPFVLTLLAGRLLARAFIISLIRPATRLACPPLTDKRDEPPVVSTASSFAGGALPEGLDRADAGQRPVRVLYVITRLIVGGAQETAILLADMLAPSRWRTVLLTGSQSGPEGSLESEARNRGIHVEILPQLVREIHPIRDLTAFLALVRHIRRQGYDIVHTHSSKAGILGRWAARLAGVPVIVHTVHGWSFHPHQFPIDRMIFLLLERLTASVTHALITVSRPDIVTGLGRGIGRRDHYVLIRSGIELPRFGGPVENSLVREELGVPPQVPVVGTVTRLSPQKAPLVFLRAVAHVLERRPDTHVVIVGDGPLRGEVEAEARRLGIADRMVFTGIRRDIPELMSLFDVFVLSSLWEGLPRVLPQAMSRGIPVVATAIDGNREILVDGVNGRLVPPNDPGLLAGAILDLLQEPGAAHRLADRARNTAEEYGARTMVRATERLYQRLLAERRR